MIETSSGHKSADLFIVGYDGRANSALEPSVGLFWAFQLSTGEKFVISEKLTLANAVRYGDCLTCETGHYEVWDRLRQRPVAELRKTPLPLFLRETEYEQIPRGRVVYETSAKIFKVYADARLHKGSFPIAILTAFGLCKSLHKFERDSHYR